MSTHINRKSAGATSAGKQVGGQFSERSHAPAPVRIGRHAVSADSGPESLRMAHFTDPRLEFELKRFAEIGNGSDDARYYEEEFAQLVPNLNRGEVTEIFLQAMDTISDGEDPSDLISDTAQRNTAAHPGGGLIGDYTPPTTIVQDDTNKQHPIVIGSKFDGSPSDVAAISKHLRSDLKEAVAANYLPAALGYSVKSRKFSGGQSIDLHITGLSDEDRFDPVLTDHYGQPQERPEAKELRKRLEALTESYNRTDRDNFASRYYGSVVIENDQGRAFREREAAERKARAKK